MRLYTCKRTEKSRPFSLFFLSPLVLFALSKFFMEEFQKRRYLGFLNFEAKEENFLFVLPSIHFVHITVRSLSHHHQREQNYASRREVAHIKSRKRCEKKSFTTSCARILAHILVSLVARESVGRNCGRARDRHFSRQKSGIVALFISQKRGAFAVEFSHPGVRGRNLSARFRNPS